ncbi:MAG: SIS domain-containing protein [Anaerolineales bacterium]
MKSFFEEYLDGVIGLLQKVRDEEGPAVQEAAIILADAIVNGKRIFGFGCTHSSLPIQDLVYRAGGLMLINPIYGPGIGSLEVQPATITSAMERLPGFADVILDNTPIEEGDVLILVSVSGRNAVPIEMAQSAKNRGITVIGVTSREYTENVEARHPSGKKMYEFADVVLDNKAVKGDAILEADEMPQKFSPASGVTSNALLHALVSATIEECLARGVTPPVYLAANVDGGEEWNKKLWDEYGDRVFYV